MTRADPDNSVLTHELRTPPTHDGRDLTFEVDCRVGSDASSGEPHRIVVHGDWSIETPHDLEAERVAMAFGGYTSCVALIDQIIPTVRRFIGLVSRSERVTLRRRSGNLQWRLPPIYQVIGCCANAAYREPGDAISHLRSPLHIARTAAAPLWLTAQVLAAFQAQWDEREAERAVLLGAHRMVREANGITRLNEAGISVNDLAELAGPASAVTDALPVGYYLGVRFNAIDLDWLRTVLSGRPDGDFAYWLTRRSTAEYQTPARAWIPWLQFGLPTGDVLFAVSQNVDPGSIAAISTETTWPPSMAARTVLRWARAGFEPTPLHFRILARRGAEHVYPSARSVELLLNKLDDLPSRNAESGVILRTELAVMLALLGNHAAVIQKIMLGATSAAHLDDPNPTR